MRVLLKFTLTLLVTFFYTAAVANGINNEGTGYTFDFTGNNCESSNILSTDPFYNTVGYSSSIVNNNLLITTTGSQFGYSTAPIRMFDASNCSGTVLDLSNPADRFIEIRVRSTVDVPQFLVMLSDGAGVADKNVDVNSLVANVWKTITINASDLRLWNNNTVDSTKVLDVCLYSRVSWGDNDPVTTDPNAAQNGTSVAGTLEVDYILVGTEATSNRGYCFDFQSNACLSTHVPTTDPFYNTVGYSGSVSNDNLFITTNGSQLGYSTFPIRMFNPLTCSQKPIDLSLPAHRKLEVRVRSTVDVPQFLVLISDGAGVADKNVDVYSLVANQWQTLIFDIADMQLFNNNYVDSTEVLDLCFYTRVSWGDNVVGTSDPNAAQNGLSVNGTLEVDYVKIGSKVNGVITSTLLSPATEKISRLEVYPNPVIRKNIVQLSQYCEWVTLYNTSGSVVGHWENTMQIDVSTLTRGVYTVKTVHGQSKLIIDSE